MPLLSEMANPPTILSSVDRSARNVAVETHDRPVGRGDPGDLACIGDQRRQDRLGYLAAVSLIASSTGPGPDVLQLADRRRIGRQLLN